MNKKLILILLCISFFAICSVGAADLENYDFDGYFTMKVPKDVSFEKEINATSEEGIDVVGATYMSENIMIAYMHNPFINENSSVSLYQTFVEQVNPESTQCYESQEGNMTIFESTAEDGSQIIVIGVTSGNKMILLAGEDMSLLKEMGHSVKFK